jgi:hypothetical protein
MSVTDLIIDPFNAGKSRNPGVTQRFMADPISTVRQHGGHVSPESEAAWRQLTAALRALQAASTGKHGDTYQGSHVLYVDIFIPT